MKSLLSAIVAILMAAAFSACSKKDSSANITSCMITSYTDTSTASGPDSTAISYNNDGKVSTIQTYSGTSYTRSIFTYVNNNLATVNRTQNGQFSEYDSIKYNNDGTVAYSYSNYGPSGFTYRVTYSYDSKGQFQSSTLIDIINATGYKYPPDTLTYQYTNGDLTTILNNNQPYETYTYYDTKANETGDVDQMTWLLQFGIALPKNTHLLQSFEEALTPVNYSYSFDADGKISKVTTTSGVSVSNRTYGYSCN